MSLSNNDRRQLRLRMAFVDEIPGMAGCLRAGPLRIQLLEARITVGGHARASVVIVNKTSADIGGSDRVVLEEGDESVPLRDVHIPRSVLHSRRTKHAEVVNHPGPCLRGGVTGRRRSVRVAKERLVDVRRSRSRRVARIPDSLQELRSAVAAYPGVAGAENGIIPLREALARIAFPRRRRSVVPHPADRRDRLSVFFASR